MAIEEQALHNEVETPSQVTELVEKLGTASRLPNLSRDVAALLAILFVVITYHIQHPTLLFRVQFGETFRDVQEQGFQEAIVYSLIGSIGLLIITWKRLLPERDQLIKVVQWSILIMFVYSLWQHKAIDSITWATLLGVLMLTYSHRKTWTIPALRYERLRLALIVGIGLYLLHICVLILQNTNIFVDSYNLNLEEFLDTLQMRRSEAEIFANTIKVLNGTALLGGLGLASIIYLWAPWNSIIHLRNKLLLDWRIDFAKDMLALLTLVLWFASYVLINPMWVQESSLAHDLDDTSWLIALGLLLVGGAFIGLHLQDTFSRSTQQERVYQRLRVAFAVGVGLYILHTTAVLLADYNALSDYYGVRNATIDELLADNARATALQPADLAAILAGVGLASILYFWSPWERWRAYVDVARRNLSAIIVAILTIVIWELGVDFFEIQQFLLPKPSAIWETFEEIYPGLIAGSWFTIKNAIQGFLVGCGAGIVTGTLSARFIRFSRAVLPLAVAANAVPIIAFAPISNAWFGLTSPDSKIAIVAVLCYFPAMISTVTGLTSVEQRQLELMKSYAASQLEIFRYLRLPTALPFIFSSLKLAATLAMIGAIVAEFFGGTPATALGFRIKNDAGLLRMTESWSAIIVASVLGIGFFLFISALERNAMPWYSSFRDQSR
ncbi:MAG: ABC transporter permease [Chloroflexi bacterium]|nr:ABC transporter permease [Chloroflexota bacterium]